MSHLAVKWAWKQDVGSSVRKLILLFMADAANPDNQWHVWHSCRTIATACNCSVGSVSNHLRWLVDYQYLVHLHQGVGIRDTNRYLFNWESGEAGIHLPETTDCSPPEHSYRSPAEQSSQIDCSPPERNCSPPERNCSSPEHNCSSGEMNCSSVVDKTVIEPVIEPVREPVRDGLQPPSASGPKSGLESEPKSRATWAAYASSYERRYGATPITNATVNSQLCRFVDRVGAQDAPMVAADYLTNNKRFYVERRHPVGVMLEDAEALHSEWVTGTRTTSTQAAQMDRSQSNLNVLEQVIAQRKAEGKL